MTMTCIRCGLAKEKTEFHNNKRKKEGKESFCKSCRSKSSRENYKNNLYTFLVRLKRYQSKKLGVPFSLTKQYLESIWTGFCPCCSKELHKDCKSSDYQYALDRIKPSLGYVEGNVAFLCARCNRIKYDATPLELENISKWLRGLERSTTISKESTQKSAEAPSPEESGDDIVCS